MALAALGYGAFAVVAVTFGLDVVIVRGWASSIAFTTLVGGTMLIGLGILGEYVGKIFEEVKGRPLYVIAHTLNIEHPATALSELAGKGQEPSSR